MPKPTRGMPSWTNCWPERSHLPRSRNSGYCTGGAVLIEFKGPSATPRSISVAEFTRIRMDHKLVAEFVRIRMACEHSEFSRLRPRSARRYIPRQEMLRGVAFAGDSFRAGVLRRRTPSAFGGSLFDIRAPRSVVPISFFRRRNPSSRNERHFAEKMKFEGQTSVSKTPRSAPPLRHSAVPPRSSASPSGLPGRPCFGLAALPQSGRPVTVHGTLDRETIQTQHMRVDLRGPHVLVTQQFLYRADIDMLGQQVRGERMAKRVAAAARNPDP